MEFDLLIQDISMLTEDYEIQEHMSIGIRDHIIQQIGPAGSMEQSRAHQTVQGYGKLAMPGLVDAHVHSCQQLLRGSLADEFPMIWLRFLVPFESTLTEEDVYYSALMCCLQEIKSGVTSIADSGGRHMHKVAEAVAVSGIRAALSRSMIDMGNDITPQMMETTQEAVDNNENLFHQFHGKSGGRIQIFFGMRQVMTCSPQLIRLIAQKARDFNTGVHAHLCEHKDEVSFCLRNYKKRPVEFLDEMGLLGPNLLTAHNVALSEHDITVLAARQVKLVHCPYANLAYHGFPKTPRLLESGISIGLGSDGAAYNSLNMFDEMRVLRVATQASQGLPVFDPVVLPVKDVLRMSMAGGAAAIGLADEIGTIEVGKKADIITIQMNQPHIFPSNNYTTALLDCVNPQDVRDSIIDGQVVMLDRKVLTLDEESIMQECNGRMKAIMARFAG